MSLSTDALIQKGAYALSVAALLAAGGTILDNKVTNVQQEARLEEITSIKADLREVTRDLTTVAKELAVTADRLQRQDREGRDE